MRICNLYKGNECDVIVRQGHSDWQDHCRANNPCNFYAEVDLTSPLGRTQHGVSYANRSYNAGQTEASASMQVLFDDGTYNAVGQYSAEDDSIPPNFTYYPPNKFDMAKVNGSLMVNGFVQITGTTWSPGTTAHISGSSVYRVSLMASQHCTGNAYVVGMLSTTLPGMSWVWRGTTNPSAVVTVPVGLGLPETLYYSDYPLNFSAPAGGGVRATAGLGSLPSGCEPRIGVTSADLTVQ